ncbi:hypothetical protein V6Z11_D08G102100 [Gossypium hirsutum]
MGAWKAASKFSLKQGRSGGRQRSEPIGRPGNFTCTASSSSRSRNRTIMHSKNIKQPVLKRH